MPLVVVDSLVSVTDNLPAPPAAQVSTVADFWRIVTPLGWGIRTTDYKALELALMQQLTPADATALRHLFRGLIERLYEKLHTARRPQDLELGDDSTDDLLAHIIGLGELEYELSLQDDGGRIMNRARKNDFVESFAYVFPSDEDYKKLTQEYYQEWAKNNARKYNAALELSHLTDVVHRNIITMVSHMNDFVAWELGPLLQAEPVVRALARRIAEQLKDTRLVGDGGSAANPHMVHNLYNDLRNYYIPFHKKPA